MIQILYAVFWTMKYTVHTAVHRENVRSSCFSQVAPPNVAIEMSTKGETCRVFLDM